MTQYIGSKIFENIEVDERVHADLAYCLYCKVTNHNPNGTLSNTQYVIPLDSLAKEFKQCPSCKRVFMVGDILPIVIQD